MGDEWQSTERCLHGSSNPTVDAEAKWVGARTEGADVGVLFGTSAMGGGPRGC